LGKLPREVDYPDEPIGKPVVSESIHVEESVCETVAEVMPEELNPE
jgi:hypothetical protein